MEYVFNWIVLLLTLGGIAIIALVCYGDLVRSTARVSGDVPSPDQSAPAVQPSKPEEMSAGPTLGLSYCRNGVVQHVQSISAGRSGYIGTESFAGFGPGLPVRLAEVTYSNQTFICTNLDWHTELAVANENGTETVVRIGETINIVEGSEIHLQGGWVIRCRVTEAAV